MKPNLVKTLNFIRLQVVCRRTYRLQHHIMHGSGGPRAKGASRVRGACLHHQHLHPHLTVPIAVLLQDKSRQRPHSSFSFKSPNGNKLLGSATSSCPANSMAPLEE